MWWKGSPIPMYQSMWYAPGMGRGTAGPCIGTICYLSVPTWSRMSKMHPWQELNTQAPQLQCHLWTVSLLMQSHLGWPHQTQQATCLRVVQTNLLHSDAAHIQPGTNVHGGTRTLHCWQIPAHLASGMHGLVCVFVFILYVTIAICNCLRYTGDNSRHLSGPS